MVNGGAYSRKIIWRRGCKMISRKSGAIQSIFELVQEIGGTGTVRNKIIKLTNKPGLNRQHVSPNLPTLENPEDHCGQYGQ